MENSCLTIGGSDPSGGAGIQLDLRVFDSLGLRGMSVISALTAQNDLGVHDVFFVEGRAFQAQLESVSGCSHLKGIKIGVLSQELIPILKKILEEFKSKNPHIPIVFDPILQSTSGFSFIDPFEIMTLFPLVDLVTPNSLEAGIILGNEISTLEELRDGAKRLVEVHGARAALIKGGHLFDGSPDVFYSAGVALDFVTKYQSILFGVRGTGCFLSSAILGHLAKEHEMDDAVRKSKGMIEIGLANAKVFDSAERAVFTRIEGT